MNSQSNSQPSMRILLFGATGSAGVSALHVALRAADVAHVTAIVRRPIAMTDPKLKVVVHDNFLDFSAIASEFDNIDTCLYAVGVSVSQVPEEAAYRRVTRDFAVAAATLLRTRSPGATFQFISGAGTRADSRFMWARVKAQAESDLADIIGAVCFRPGAIDGRTSESQHKTWYAPLKPLFKVFAPFRSLYVTGDDLGRAMLQSAREGRRRTILENRDIRDLADRSKTTGDKR